MGGLALPHHINATSHEAMTLLELPADATRARAPMRESRSLQDEKGRHTSFINTIWVVIISNHRIFCDKPYRSTSVQLVKILDDRSVYRVHKHFNGRASVLLR